MCFWSCCFVMSWWCMSCVWVLFVLVYWEEFRLIVFWVWRVVGWCVGVWWCFWFSRGRWRVRWVVVWCSFLGCFWVVVWIWWVCCVLFEGWWVCCSCLRFWWVWWWVWWGGWVCIEGCWVGCRGRFWFVWGVVFCLGRSGWVWGLECRCFCCWWCCCWEC